jgi:DNA-binding MarR family transcriptional regulator
LITDDRLVYLLGRAQHCLGNYVKQVFERERLNMTPVQSGILFLLQQKARTMTEISRELAIDNSATTGLVDRLERAGLARRCPHPKDRRTFLIEITDDGSIAIERAYNVIGEVNAEIKAGFSDSEMEIFQRVVNSFFTKFKKE